MALEIAQTGFVREFADQPQHRAVGDFQLGGAEAVLFPLPGKQVPLSDGDLLVGGVPGNRDLLHAIAQRRRHRRHQVRRRDEEDSRQIEGHVQVVVLEREVLLRVEDLQQGGAGVTAEIGPQLVDLVEHEHGVVRAGLLDALDDASRQRADVGPAMPPDLGLVVHPAQRDAREAPAHGAGDRATQGCLADARRPDEAQDRPLDLLTQVTDGEVFENSLLDLGKAEMIVIEDTQGPGDVELILGGLLPRQVEQPVEVRAHDRVFRRPRHHVLEPAELALGRFRRFRGQLGALDARAQLVGLGGEGIAAAQLLLDLLELLAQEVLALRLADLFLHL